MVLPHLQIFPTPTDGACCREKHFTVGNQPLRQQIVIARRRDSEVNFESWPRKTRNTMSERIGIVTGGGDCPGLNAVIRAVAKAAAKRGWETIGFLGGYEGILEPQRYFQLDYQKLGALLTRGGTILGTANRGRFSAKVGHGQTRSLPQELIDGVKSGLRKLDIRGLVSIGGDGSLSIGQQLFEGVFL